MARTRPEIDALHRPTTCVCGKVFYPDRKVISGALKTSASPTFYCSATCSRADGARRMKKAVAAASSPEAIAKRRATVEKMIAAGTWTGPNSLRDHAIEKLVRDGAPCGQCGKIFHPGRDVACRYLQNQQGGIFCSRECAHLHASVTTSGVERDPDSGFGKAEHNINAHFYCVKSPDNVRYAFRNANHFVREHPSLFTEKQRTLSRNGTVIPAACGLRSLFLEKIDYRSGLKYTPTEWRGWTGVWKKDRLGNIVWERGEPN